MTYYFKWDSALFDRIMRAFERAARSSSTPGMEQLYNQLDGYRSDVRNSVFENRPDEIYYPVMRQALYQGLTAMAMMAEGEINRIRIGQATSQQDGDIDLGPLRAGTAWHVYGFTLGLQESERADIVVMPELINYLGTTLEQPSQSVDVVTTIDANLRIYTPSPERLESLPVNARSFATRIATAPSGNQNSVLAITRSPETGEYSSERTDRDSDFSVVPSADELIQQARQAYREWLTLSMRRNVVDPDETRKRREAREESARRFSAFVRRTPDAERHVPTLPFVPHGLSSSRRWGIEVESGGARGVAAPDKWRRIGDGSLRSAWDGYVEVQDFEPFDEEVTEYRRYMQCPEYGERHIFEEYYYDGSTGRDSYRARENYVDPAGCEHCGNVTRTVHRVPATIRHTAQGDDCGEFVSPILVSMHSNGLESLIDQLILQPQNKSAGVHVHVEATDLSAEQVATLIFGYDVLEPILEASYQREARRYCQRREVDVVLDTARKLRGANKPTESEVRGGDRYVTLNTTSLNAHGTIEFRAMGPVYDYDYLVRWAMLCRELVNVVAAGVTTKRFSKIKSWDDLTMLLAEYGKEYMRAVVYEQTGETGTAADLVKREQPVTTAALNADWESFMAGMGTSNHSFQRMGRVFENFADRVNDLVTVGAATASGRNATWQV